VIDWLKSLVSNAVGGVTNKVVAVASSLVSLWNTIVGFWTRIRAGLTAVRNWVVHWINTAIRYAFALLGLLRYIMTVLIPGIVDQAVARLVAFVHRLINEAAVSTLSALDSLRRWAAGLLAATARSLDDLQRWTLARIAEILADLRRIKNLVFTLLDTAEHLVAWLLGALITALGRWILGNVERLAKAAWRVLPRILLSGASLIEGIVARII
jgi:hypothetical protein